MISSSHKMATKKNIFNTLREREEENNISITSIFQNSFYKSRKVLKTLKNTLDLNGHDGCVNTISFNESGDLLLSGSDDGTLKIWNPFKGECLQTLLGHISNVFAGSFLNHKNDKVVSGGNDSDVRFYDIETGKCIIFSHHISKVLSLSVNKFNDCWLTCSHDGTVRMFDIREKYSNTKHIDIPTTIDDEDYDILPQAFGGGRSQQNEELNTESLIVKYKNPFSSSGVNLFSVDFHPRISNQFIVSSSLGDVRLFDLRMIRNYDSNCCVNKYTDSYRMPMTGCKFSYDGSQIISTKLDKDIYLFDTQRKNGKKKTEDEEKQSKNDSENESRSSNSDENSYVASFTGHISSRTIKGCGFWGLNSEFVISGSDDSNVYIWNKETSKIETILSGHRDVVNCAIGHPSIPMVVSSGIERMIKIWTPEGDCPTDEEHEYILSKIERKPVELDLVNAFCGQQ